jgi:hypothetical protein
MQTIASWERAHMPRTGPGLRVRRDFLARPGLVGLIASGLIASRAQVLRG